MPGSSTVSPDFDRTGVDRTGIIRIDTRGEELCFTRSTLRLLLTERAGVIKQSMEKILGRPVTRLLVAPVAGYVLDVLPDLIGEFSAVAFADNFKAGQIFGGIECIAIDDALARPDAYDAVLLGTVDPKLCDRFRGIFPADRTVLLSDLIGECAPDHLWLPAIRQSLRDADAAIAGTRDPASLLRFVEALTCYAYKGGDISEFGDALNSIFRRTYPGDGHVDGDQGLIERVRAAYGRIAAVPYPDGYVVAVHWDRKQSGFARVALMLDDPAHLVICAQYGRLSAFDHRIIDDRALARSVISDKISEIRRDFGVSALKDFLIEESPFSIGGSLHVIDGRRYSNIFLSHVHYCLRLRHLLDGRRARLIEIGGGYGSLARIFKLNGPIQYIIVDLPGSLVFSQIFLELNFSQSDVYLLDSVESFSAARLQSADFVLVPIQFLNLIADIDVDLVINTGSMQEMPQSTVDYFMKCIESVWRVRNFYSHNYFLCPKQDYAETSGRDNPAQSNLICPKLDANWEVVLAQLNPRGLTIDCADRNWLELLVERLDTTETNAARALEHFQASQALSVMSDAWLLHMLAALFSDPQAQYVLKFIDGIEYFMYNDIGASNNILNEDGFSLKNREKSSESNKKFTYHSKKNISQEEKVRMFEALGEIKYLRNIISSMT